MYPSKGYEFGIEEGEYKVTLDYKMWGNNKSGGFLRLYFTEAAQGRKFYLSVFWPEKYKPTNGGPNFKDDVDSGTQLTINVGKTRTNKPKFLTAEKGWK